jgi:hypothetical protein
MGSNVAVSLIVTVTAIGVLAILDAWVYFDARSQAQKNHPVSVQMGRVLRSNGPNHRSRRAKSENPACAITPAGFFMNSVSGKAEYTSAETEGFERYVGPPTGTSTYRASRRRRAWRTSPAVVSPARSRATPTRSDAWMSEPVQASSPVAAAGGATAIAGAA